MRQKNKINFVKEKFSGKENLVFEKENPTKNKINTKIGKKLSFIFAPINKDNNTPKIKYPYINTDILFRLLI
ncbi:hypothetical protein GCM10023210_38130 [Chryseobacterium ginsengisoli]|uniref:Uncharacterized protein n=1 Tax=Chryseobacterium ginsengisoli TaxID=363853 RepID=A0ABP9MT20_9FLAO